MTRPKWYRATFILVLCEPPHLYYEPKEWSEATVVMEKMSVGGGEDDSQTTLLLKLPGGPLLSNQTYDEASIGYLRQHGIDVCQPQNCLHHLFTFPMELETESSNQNEFVGVWGDFYECVARGPLPEAEAEAEGDHSRLSWHSLAELKRMTDDTNDPDGNSLTDTLLKKAAIQFAPETLYALQLYFQRQSDLRAKRRLLKGYSSSDLEQYGLQHRSSSSIGSHKTHSNKLVLTDLQSDSRQDAINYTMQCDDGMSPGMLCKANAVLLGVSRAGKTPLSIYMAQTLGLKVANIPLVMELPPPSQLKKVNPRKVRSAVQ
ncbi:MAG: hypothetical protein SGILL_009087 [Bacillariaceae sp.]